MSRIVVVDVLKDPETALVLILPRNNDLEELVLRALSESSQFEWARLSLPPEERPKESLPPPSPSATRRAESSPKRRYKTKRTIRKKCPECGNLFHRKGLGPHMIQVHGKWIHGKPVKPSPKKLRVGTKLECPVCNKTFDVRGITRHMRTTHPDEARAASAIAAKDKAREVRGSTVEQFLRDVVAGRRSIPQTSLGQAIAETATKHIPPGTVA